MTLEELSQLQERPSELDECPAETFESDSIRPPQQRLGLTLRFRLELSEALGSIGGSLWSGVEECPCLQHQPQWNLDEMETVTDESWSRSLW